MQRPLGEPLRGRARIERFDRDLLRIERRIERKLVAGVGEAKKSKPRSEHQGPHREASCYDRAVLTARMVVDRKSTRLNSSHSQISYAVFCLKKKRKENDTRTQRRRKRLRVSMRTRP